MQKNKKNKKKLSIVDVDRRRRLSIVDRWSPIVDRRRRQSTSIAGRFNGPINLTEL